MEEIKGNKVKSLFGLSKEFTDLIAIGGSILELDFEIPKGLLELLYNKSKTMYQCASSMYFESLDDGTEDSTSTAD